MDSVQQIKQRLSIGEVVGSYLDIKKSGKNYKGICPFHSENTPSFMVSPDLGIYKCFGCGASGDIFSFVQEMDGISFHEALKKLAEKAGVELEESYFDHDRKGKQIIYKINETVTKFYSYLLLKHKSGERGLNYLLKDRGLTKEVIATFGLGYAPKSWELSYEFLKKQGFNDHDLLRADLIKNRGEGKGYYDKFRGRVIFPLVDTTTKIVGFMARTIFNEDPKYLNTADTPVFNKSAFMYGLGVNRIGIKKEGAIFVEGPMDVITAYQHGVKNIVAPLGTSLTAGHLKIISRYTKDVVFCFDSDTAGLEAIKRAVLLAEKLDLNVKVIMIPKEFRDLDEVFQKDATLAKELFSSAVSAYDFFVAYAVGKYDPKSAVGKKKIVEELAQLFSGVSNEVTLDHYVKEVSRKLDIAENIIYSVFKSEIKASDVETLFKGDSDSTLEESANLSHSSTETYFLSLLLKTTDTLEVRPFLEVIVPDQLSSRDARAIFGGLQSYILRNGKNKFDIMAFIDTIDARLRSLVEELYLWEGFSVLDQDKFLLELETVVGRLQSLDARRNIDLLRKKLALAEQQGDISAIKGLTVKIGEYSKKIR